MADDTFPSKTDAIDINGVIFTHRDIESVVEEFYTQIQFDIHLEVPFRSVHDWPEHIKRLTHFWWIRFGGKPYMFGMYNPVLKHFFAGFNEDLLGRWLKLFRTTLENNLSEPQVALWGQISERMGHSLSLKNEMYKREHESQ